MRFLTPTERGYINDPAGHSCFVYVEVTNADGSWINLSDVVVGARNVDFLTTFSFSDNQDANTHSITITLMRDVGASSLSPFRSDSPLNVDDTGTAFAPLADLHRQWRLFGVILPRGTFPSSPADYREWWTGNTDRLDVQGDPATITLQGRGKEADLIDARVIDVPKTYVGDDLGPWIQTALDGQMGVGVVPLTVDGSAPAFFVNDRDLGPTDDMGLMDLITETAALPGALTRYKYDASDVLTFTLFAPNRSPSAPDWSTTADEYEKLDAGIGIETIINYVVVNYMDAVAGRQQVTSPVTPVSASITRYGLRVMVIDLAAKELITDQTAAGNFADAIRSDLEFPIIEQTFSGHGLWFAELGDYVQLVANGVHYDQDQYGGITSIQHTYANGELKSSFGIRGNPSGRYRTWLDYGPGAPRVPTPPTIEWVSATYFEIVFIFIRSARVSYAAKANAWTRSILFELSLTQDFAVVLDSAAFDIAAGGGVAASFFPIADVDRGQVFWVRATPYSGPLAAGVPTGTAGLPAVDSTGVQFKAPTQPEFDDLQDTVTDLQGEPFTVYDDPTNLTAARKWVDSADATIDLSTPGEIAVLVPGATPEAAGAGTGVYEVTFFDYGSAQERLKSIPSSFTEVTDRLRRAALLAGMGTMRLVGNVVDLAGGDERVRIGYAAAGGSSFTDPGAGADLPLSRLGVVRSDWMAVPVGMASDVDVSPHVLGGDGTRRARLTSLKLQCSPATRAGGITPPVGGGAGTTYHYDAQALVGYADEDPVTTWPDVSGNGNHAPAGNASFPGHYDTGVMNGYPGVRIESLGGNARGYDPPGTYAPSNAELVVVVRARAGGKPWHFGSISLAPSIPTTSGGTMDDHFGSNVLRSFVIGVDPTQPFIYRVQASNGSWTCWVNGVQKLTSASNTIAAMSGGKIGIWLSGGAFANIFDGWFGEVILRSAWSSSATRAAEDALLKSKWGIP